ncbi:hypothetical protein [Herbaspirillum huttiense]|uniref:Uncharacterized protein n=1 Tax=Herbaspirillum huttiense TaxID=863372 RepID=A0AAJ2LTK7_9BURK|nr:hypothetical protein [Herbaspirillum huttiense]MDR9836390.1 hypothetical protein [Herbaspirillum huttiense]
METSPALMSRKAFPNHPLGTDEKSVRQSGDEMRKIRVPQHFRLHGRGLAQLCLL